MAGYFSFLVNLLIDHLNVDVVVVVVVVFAWQNDLEYEIIAIFYNFVQSQWRQAQKTTQQIR